MSRRPYRVVAITANVGAVIATIHTAAAVDATVIVAIVAIVVGRIAAVEVTGRMQQYLVSFLHEQLSVDVHLHTHFIHHRQLPTRHAT